MPEEVQLRRTKGWRMPANTVKVTRPGPHGNGFKVGEDHSHYLPGADRATAEQCVELFVTFGEAKREVDPEGFRAWLAPLRGKNLACFCAIGSPCHRRPLLEWANAA